MTAPARVRSARAVAGRAVHRVTEEGAWTRAALDAEIDRAGLDARDAALATELAYGVLRVLPELDATLDAKLRRPGGVDRLARAALRVGAYELAHLARIPVHAAVGENVEWVREVRGRVLAGLVNAVLRKLAVERPPRPAPPTRMLVPTWIARVLEESLGAARTEALLAIPEGGPPLGLRVREDADLEAVRADLRVEREGIEIDSSRLVPRALLVRRAGDVRTLAAWRDGRFTVQEEGAQLVAHALGAAPGEAVADACAGHGGKALLLAERVGPRGRVLALERDARKLTDLDAERARLGLPPVAIEARVADLVEPIDGCADGFDRALVDAPCSGLGTLVRRPEIALRLQEHDLARLAEVQLAILDRVSALVREGGTLAYAVCSPTREEGAAVAERFEATRPAFERIVTSESGLPSPDADGVLRIGPWLGEGASSAPDGYQVIRWRRRSR